MNSEILKALKKEKEKIEKEFNVIIIETSTEYVAYENKSSLEKNSPLCSSQNLTDLRSTLKLYLS